MARRGENLYRREGTYYLRLSVPAPLRALFGTGELRRSLATGNKRRAQAAARRLLPELHNLFAQLEAPHMPRKPTPQEIQRIVDGLFRQIWDASEMQLAMSPPKDIREWSEVGERLNRQGGEMQLALALGGHDLVADKARRVVDKFDLDAPEGSPEYALLCRELLKMAALYYQAAEARRMGDYARANALVPVPPVMTAPALEAPCVPTPTIAELIEQYAAERRRGGAWAAKSEGDARAALEHLTFILGPETQVGTLDKARLRYFKETLLRMPPNRAKRNEYKGKTAEEILAMNPSRALTVTTVNNTLGHVSGLFNYGKDQGYMTDNPASDLSIRKGTRADEEREAFTLADLRAIFGQDDYTADSFKSGWHFWLPLLGLYTGARIEELAQLHLEDIRQEQGVWVLDIRAGDGKRVKTSQSARLVPLHRVLLKVVDLPGYAARLRKKGEVRLFPDLEKKDEADRYSKVASQFFSRMFKKRLGLVGKKSFHSFRHSFITRAKELGVDPVALMELDGHKVSGETFGRYGKRLSPALLKERVLDKLDYPGLSLKHLAGSRFAR